MGNIVQLIPHYTQPQQPVGIDRSNPLGKTVTHCIPFNGENRDIVTGTALTIGTGFLNGLDRRGKHAASGGTAAFASIPINLSAYTKISVSFWLYWDVFADNDALAMEYTPNYGGAGNAGFIIDPNSSSLAFDVGVAGAGVYNTLKFTRPSAAAWHHYVINFDRTTGAAASSVVYVDGVLQSVSASATLEDVVDNFTNSTLYIFSRNNASLFGAGSIQNLVIRGQYLMSASEAKAEYDNPWQIFQPEEVPIWFADAGGVALAGAAASTATATGSITQSVPIAGASVSTATASGALSVSIPLSGAATVTANASGGLSLSIPFSGSAVAQALASAGITQSTPLSGGAAATAAAPGALSINISLAGAAITVAAAAAGLTVGTNGLQGDAAAIAAASGALTKSVPLSGAALSVSGSTGNVTQLVPLAGASAAASLATGGLDLSVNLSGAALSRALAAAGLTAQGGFAGDAAAVSGATGTVTLTVNLDGAAVARAIASGALTGSSAVVDHTWLVRPKARRYFAQPDKRIYKGSR